MQLDPRTNKLYTDAGVFLKRLSCPKTAAWKTLRDAPSAGGRICDACERTVFDTARLSDQQLVTLLAAEPDACLAVSAAQENCTVVPRF